VAAFLLAADESAAPRLAVVSERTPGSPPANSEYTRFERARILGARALQVSLGAPILIDIPAGLIDPVEIAEREFAAGVIPITVRRGPR
jgi:DNA-directed RNA polymerase subunit K